MLTIEIKTESGPEIWQAVEREDGWYIRKDPNLQWSDEPYAAPEADRHDVAQLLRKDKDIRY